MSVPKDHRQTGPGAPLTTEREQYRRLMAQGMNSHQACLLIGVHPTTGMRWSKGRNMVDHTGKARWLAAYTSDGSVGRSARSDRSTRRLPAEQSHLSRGWRCVDRRRRWRRCIGRRSGWRKSGAGLRRRTRWCSRIIAGLDRGLVSLAQHGDAGNRDEFELVLRRESAHPNDLWQADHTELDVMVLDEAGQPVRPWLTMILDDRSRAVAGYTVFLDDPSSLQTALALRQAIWRKTDPGWPVSGLPAALYSDHGADFTSAHMSQVCADLKVQLIHSTPGVPRGAEKWRGCSARSPPNCCPPCRDTSRPSNFGKPVTPAVLTLSELDAAVGRWVVNDYHHRVHPETGETPVRRWLAGGWLPRMPESLDELNLLLLTVATPRKVHRDGIRCHGLRYLAVTLAAYVGEEVTVRYDPRDLAEIRVFHHGEFLCVAVSPDLAAASISLKDLQTARNRRRRELHRELTSRRSLVDMLTHPVRETVPQSAATIPRTPTLVPADSEPPVKTKLKIYREE